MIPKIRVWVEQHKQMVYPSTINTEILLENDLIQYKSVVLNINGKVSIVYDLHQPNNAFSENVEIEVPPEHVMAGFTIDGKDYYDGDIVEIENSFGKNLVQVKYGEYEIYNYLTRQTDKHYGFYAIDLHFEEEEPRSLPWFFDGFYTINVIGNTFENPELLEVKE